MGRPSRRRTYFLHSVPSKVMLFDGETVEDRVLGQQEGWEDEDASPEELQDFNALMGRDPDDDDPGPPML